MRNFFIVLLIAVVCTIGRSQSGSTLNQAMRFYEDKNYFMTEALLMGADRPVEDLELETQLLLHTAYKLGNLEGKINYFSGYLNRSSNQRKMALLFRAWGYAYLKQWGLFQSQAVSALVEIEEFPHHTQYVLLYCLARYTNQSVRELGLTPCEQKWFNEVREAPPSSKYPVLYKCDTAPAFLQSLIKLGTDSRSAGAGFATPMDETIQQLRQIESLLKADNLNEAANRFNHFDKSSLKPFPWDFTIEYHKLLARFFELNEEPERQDRTLKKIKKMEAEFKVNFNCYQDQVQPRVVVEKKQVEIVVPDRLNTFEDIEQALPLLDAESFQQAVNEMNSRSLYDRIYKKYLLGLYNLSKGRLQKAYTFLSKAEVDVIQTPFFILEAKVLSAMGTYYLKEKNLEQANWYWLSAGQTLCGSDALPYLQSKPFCSLPFDAMIDSLLLKKVDNQVSSILYAHQMRELNKRRLDAYRKGVLTDNKVIGNQIVEIGSQIVEEIRIMQHSAKLSNFTSLNELNELWGQLWRKTKPDFKNLEPLNLTEIKRALDPDETLIVLTEGKHQLGAVVISNEQAFATYLGPKKGFINSLAQLVDQQLGSALTFSKGKGLISLSSSYRNADFIRHLQKTNPGKPVQIMFQLADVQQKGAPVDFRHLVYLYDSTVKVPADFNAKLTQGVDAAVNTSFTDENVKRLLSQDTLFVFQGHLSVKGGSVFLGMAPKKTSLWSLALKQKLNGLGFIHTHLDIVNKSYDELSLMCYLGQYPILFINGSSKGLSLPRQMRPCLVIY
ncbi:MAG: hypothetical protein CSA81_08125 [Acidobacteria bacterium]|nr:MAG: hypothetical protein CSA81_08125 [Acidobacteriota bacterium]PIE89693.1 MAG: hypothetical protein CR997_09660 [Acidobacteriota bacterium]